MPGRWDRAGVPPLMIKLREDFEAMLERVEAAQDGQKSPGGDAYELLDVQADTELAKRFIEHWGDMLSFGELGAYMARVKFMQQRAGRLN